MLLCCFTTIQQQLDAKEKELVELRTDAERLERERDDWKVKYEEHKVYVV